MLNSLLVVILTSALTSVVTLALAYGFYEIRLRKRLEAYVAELANELESRVRKGVTDAGIELLPAFQERVEAGFREAMASLPEQGANTLAKAGASLIEGGLSTLFGKRTSDR